ncbi:MAG: hypothetical protein AAF160_05590 [Pseudomonadota bacterium]
MRLVIVTALIAGSLALVQPADAAHRSCAGGVLPAPDQCASKEGAIARIGNSGGTAVCRAAEGAPFSLQYDRVSSAGYQCSHFHSCNWAQLYDPAAWKAFCEIDQEALEEDALRRLLEAEEVEDAPAE